MTRHSELHQDYTRQATKLQALIAAATELQHLQAHAFGGAQVLMSAGSGEASERVSGGDRSDPVLDRVFARAWAATHLADLDDALDAATASLTQARAHASSLASAGRKGDQTEAPTRTNMVDCIACQRTITMTSEDRPRSGYCNACRMAWQRLTKAHTGPGAPDRVRFEHNRAVWAGFTDDAPVVRTAGSRITEITRNGRTVSVTAAQSAELLAHGPSIPVTEIEALFGDEPVERTLVIDMSEPV